MTLDHLAVSVDGNRVAAASVLCLFQREAFPGGHRYQVEARGGEVNRWLSAWPRPIDEDSAREMLFVLERLLGHLSDRADTESADWFLNTVDRADLDGDRLVVEGTCSAVIQQFEDTRPS